MTCRQYLLSSQSSLLSTLVTLLLLFSWEQMRDSLFMALVPQGPLADREWFVERARLSSWSLRRQILPPLAILSHVEQCKFNASSGNLQKSYLSASTRGLGAPTGLTCPVQPHMEPQSLHPLPADPGASQCASPCSCLMDEPYTYAIHSLSPRSAHHM